MIVFIAGPFRAATPWEQEQNIRRAETLALEVWREGHVALCPHAMTRFYQDAAPDDVWLSGMRMLLARSDAVLTVDGWEESEGSRLEIDVAREHGLPVYHSIGQIR